MIDGHPVRFVAPAWVTSLAERAVTEKLAKRKGLPFAEVWARMTEEIGCLARRGKYYVWVDREPRADALGARIRERLARGEPEAVFDEELEAATLAFGLTGPNVSGGTMEQSLARPERAFWHWVDRAGPQAALRTFFHALRFRRSFVEREVGEPREFSLVMPEESRTQLDSKRDLPIVRAALRAFGVAELSDVLREAELDEVLAAWLTDDRAAAGRLNADAVNAGKVYAMTPIGPLLDDAAAASSVLEHMNDDEAILRVVLGQGLGVVEAVFRRVPDDDGNPRRWIPALACYPSVPAARLLVSMLETRAVRKVVGDALGEMPEEALVALREELAKRPKFRDAIESLIATLGARTTRQAGGPSEAATSEVPREDVPPVLANPPWRAKKRAKEIVTEGLAAQDLPPVVDLSFADPDLVRRDLEFGRYRQKPSLPTFADALAGSQHFGPETLAILGLEEIEYVRQHDLFERVNVPWWRRDAYTPGLLGLLQTHGVAVVPALTTVAHRMLPELSCELACVGAVALAPVAVSWLGYKASRKAAEGWARRFPEHAARGLLPIALGKPGTSRSRATHLLTLVERAGHRDVLLAVAAGYGEEVSAATAQLLARDPLEDCPAKPPKLPEGLDALPQLTLRDGRPLPNEARTALVELLAFSPLDPPYAGLASVIDAVDPRSRGELAEALVRAWVAGGMASAHEWMVRQVALIGTDDTARFLDGRARAWAQDGAKKRALLALDVLGAMGSDLALSLVGRVSRSSQRESMKDRALAILAEIAEVRGLTADELEDRTAPDLGLDESGTLTLDFGPRVFQVGFDEHLRPFVRKDDGSRLDAMPRALKTDDPAKAKAASAAWKALKSEAEKVSADQIARLERMMGDERRVDASVFLDAFVRHPLVGHLARRLVWGTYDAAGKLLATFRIAEDRSFATVHDDVFVLPDDARVGLVHPLVLPKDELSAWAAQLSDYEIVQPFAQLGRECVSVGHDAIAPRYSGKKAPSSLLYGLRRHGWRVSADESGIASFHRRLGGASFTLHLTPSLASGESTLHDVSLSETTDGGAGAPSTIQLAELVHQLDAVLA